MVLVGVVGTAATATAISVRRLRLRAILRMVLEERPQALVAMAAASALDMPKINRRGRFVRTMPVSNRTRPRPAMVVSWSVRTLSPSLLVGVAFDGGRQFDVVAGDSTRRRVAQRDRQLLAGDGQLRLLLLLFRSVRDAVEQGDGLPETARLERLTDRVVTVLPARHSAQCFQRGIVAEQFRVLVGVPTHRARDTSFSCWCRTYNPLTGGYDRRMTLCPV